MSVASRRKAQGPSWREIVASSGAAQSVASRRSEETDDHMLDRLGLFDTLRPAQPILFGVVTGGGMEERYGALARTCGPALAACLYFSNSSSKASPAVPATTIDIVDEERGYLEAELALGLASGLDPHGGWMCSICDADGVKLGYRAEHGHRYSFVLSYGNSKVC